MLRTPEWKLVRYLRAPERDEFFNLVDDPEELRNEIQNPIHEELISRLHKKLLQRMVETSDPALEYLQPL